MLKQVFALPDIFWALSIFRFKKSFLDTFLLPVKWLTFWKTSNLLKSIVIFDQDHMRFQELRKSNPWGSSLHPFFLENALVIISYTSVLFFTTLKYNEGSLFGSISFEAFLSDAPSISACVSSQSPSPVANFYAFAMISSRFYPFCAWYRSCNSLCCWTAASITIYFLSWVSILCLWNPDSISFRFLPILSSMWFGKIP